MTVKQVFTLFEDHVSGVCLWNNHHHNASLTKWYNNWTGDAVGHDHSENVHHPGISSSKLELISLML